MYKSQCTPLSLQGELLQTCEEFVFLGSVVCANNSKFTISLSKNKLKFFINANKILSKIGTSNIPLIMSIVNSYCLSALLYNLEIFELTKNW